MATLQDLAIKILIKKDRVEKDLDKVRKSFDKAWSGIQAGAAAAGVVAGAALTAGLVGAIDSQRAQAKLEASLGDAEFAEQAGRIAGGLYASGWGESSGDVINAAGAVASSIESLRDTSDEALSSATRKALAFAEAFNVDVTEASRNAGILISNGLAKDATEAFDLMVASLRNVPEALRGEVMDATQEYTQFFAQLGFTGEQTLGLIGSAAADAGQYGIDKMGDAIKEFNIRATDMSALTQTAFQTIGLDAQTMASQLLAGGDTAQGAFQQIVSGLRNIQDPVLQSNTAIALFGTQLEDLGTGNVPEFLASLDPATTKLTDVAGAADGVASTLEDGQSPLEAFKREVQTALVEQMEKAVPYLRDAAKWLKEHKGIVIPLVVALGVFAGIIGTIIAITKIWTAVQIALNIAMSLNPIGLIVLAIIALIAIGILLWKNWDTVVSALGAAWNWIWEKLKAFGKWIWDIWWTNGWKRIIDALAAAWNWVVEKLREGADKIKEWIGSALDFITGIPDKIKEGLKKVGEFLSAPFKAGLDAIKKFWNNTIGGKGFDLPSWIPGVGGKSFRFPTFHDGGVVPGSGDQIIRAKGGEGVFTRDQMAALGQRGTTTIVFQGDGTRASQAVGQLFAEFIKGQGLQVVTR